MNINIKEFIQLLKKYLRKQKAKVFFMIFLVLLSTLLSYTKPKLIGIFISNIENRLPLANLILIAVVFMVIVFLQSSVKILEVSVAQKLGWDSTNSLRLDLVKHLTNLDLAFHKKFSAGQLLERIDGDIRNLFSFFTSLVSGILLNGLLIVGGMIYLAFVDYRFFFTFASAILLLGIFFVLIQKRISLASEMTNEYRSRYNGEMGEQITSIDDIYALNAQKYMEKRSRMRLRDLRKYFDKDMKYFWYSWAYSDLIFEVLMIVNLLLSAYLLSKGQVSIATAFEVFFISDFIRNPIDEFREQIQYLEKVDGSIKRIKELLNVKRTISVGNKEMGLAPSIEVENLGFSYDEGEKVLSDISFSLENGKILGLIGRTGSGKTTLARLLVKLYESNEGTIRYGDISLRDISDSSLRSKVAYITQEIQIFNASLRDNVTIYREGISDERIMEVIKLLGIEGILDKLEMGLDTILSPENTSLSSGEMQMLTLIRVFLMDPEIIILDEATAKLDPVTEKHLEKALDILLKDKTAIIIAHRLKTIMRSDQILILENGKIKEAGKTKDLMKDKNSSFSKLLEKGMEEVLV